MMTACLHSLKTSRLDTTTPVETTSNEVDISALKTPVKSAPFAPSSLIQSKTQRDAGNDELDHKNDRNKNHNNDKKNEKIDLQNDHNRNEPGKPPDQNSPATNNAKRSPKSPKRTMLSKLSKVHEEGATSPELKSSPSVSSAMSNAVKPSLARRQSVKWKGVVEKVHSIQKVQRSNSKGNASQWSDWSDSEEDSTEDGQAPSENGIGGSDKKVHPALNRRTSTWSMLGRRSGYNIGGVIVPMLHTKFKSSLIESLYQDYYSRQHGYCIVLLNVIALLVNTVFLSICLSTEEIRAVRFWHVGFYVVVTALRIAVCVVVLVKYAKKTRRKGQVASFVTWFLLTFQAIAEGVVDCVYLTDYTSLFLHMCQMIYAIFVTYTLMPVTSPMGVAYGVVTSLVYVLFVIVRLTVILDVSDGGLVVRHVSMVINQLTVLI
jgi:hypothetical protein